MDREGRAWEQARSARDEVRRQVATSDENGRRRRLDLLRAPVAGRFVGSKGDPGAKISTPARFQRRRGICGKADRRPNRGRELDDVISHRLEPISHSLESSCSVYYFYCRNQVSAE